MTKDIAEKLAGLEPRDLVGVVSRWNTMPIKENIATVSKSFVARLGESLGVVSPHSILQIRPFARNFGIIATLYLDADRKCRVSLEREKQKCSIIIGDYQINTADEFDNCIRLVLTNFLMQLDQVLAVPSGSPR
ncbi:MAG: hypothetical protein G01um101429_1132 [Parcubacteria group bacterium Gr01-1014_29]|nr:MAG: hypothetical protein G01um101429_1132 [Parcubacteria group bacterium Gr01-1014_29]